MATAAHRPETTLHIRRSFPHPRQKVFQAWTEAERSLKRLGPRGMPDHPSKKSKALNVLLSAVTLS